MLQVDAGARRPAELKEAGAWAAELRADATKHDDHRRSGKQGPRRSSGGFPGIKVDGVGAVRRRRAACRHRIEDRGVWQKQRDARELVKSESEDAWEKIEQNGSVQLITWRWHESVNIGQSQLLQIGSGPKCQLRTLYMLSGQLFEASFSDL